MAGADSRKTRSIEYYLPSDGSCDVVRVCRGMFLNTVNITERQVCTTLEKLTTTGNLQPENREADPMYSNNVTSECVGWLFNKI